MANHHHFLVVSVEAQGHINPSRYLAHKLVSSTGARVSLAIPKSAYRRMFPSSTADEEDGVISYSQYSDGIEDGLNPAIDLPLLKDHIKHSLARLARDLADRGRPVTCIIYALFLSMAADVAQDLGISSVLLWIQPAAVFAIYHRYFHGLNRTIDSLRDDPSSTVQIPGLPLLQIRDLPSLLITSNDKDNNNPYPFIITLFADVFKTLDRDQAKPTRILVNTFQELESELLSSIEGMEMIAVGPLAGADKSGGDLFKESSRRYMEWLDTKPDGSVVYVSFGSISKISQRQMDEIREGLAESGRPYLWVVRHNNGGTENDDQQPSEEDNGGMVVEWCSQVGVLSHRAVGCFVTHCGWNSTLESIACGVPTVMVPQWMDQTTNSRLAEVAWGTGVRSQVDGEGVLEGKELIRCLDLVMGEEGWKIRERVEEWRTKAREAVGEGGSSSRNLAAFMRRIEDGPLPKS